MQELTPADIRTRFPEFNHLTDSQIQAMLDLAYCMFAPLYFGCMYDELIYQYVAHKLYTQFPDSAGNKHDLTIVGSSVSESLGAASRSYSLPDSFIAKYGNLIQSSYGLNALEIIRTRGSLSTII